MKKYMCLILLLAVLAVSLLGCGQKQQDQEQTAEVDPSTENTLLSETNMVPAEDAISFLEYCDGTITLRFSLEEEGKKWVWVDEPSFPLDGEKVDEIITALKELGQLQKAPAIEDLSLYGLSDAQKYLTLKGETMDGIMQIGDQAEDGSWYASVAGYEDIFLIPDAFMQLLHRSVYDMALLPTLPDFSAENLMYISVESGDSRAALRKTEEQWTSTNEKITERVEEVATALSALQVSRCFDFLPSSQALSLTGFSTPTATITVEYLNSVNVESSFSMTLGALRNAEEGYYVTFNDDSTIYLIPSSQVSPLLVLLIYAK